MKREKIEQIKIESLKNCEINEISENGDSFLRFNTLYNNSDELETNDKVGFDITQTDGFHIEDSIYGMYEINENEDKDGKHSIKKNLCLKSNLSMIEINNFIEKCIKIFDDYQEKQTSKGPFIFNYKGKKNDFPIFDEKTLGVGDKEGKFTKDCPFDCFCCFG